MHGLPVEQSRFSEPDTHLPDASHLSLSEHGSPSSQSRLATGVNTQRLDVLQASSVQTFLSSQTTVSPPLQTPA